MQIHAKALKRVGALAALLTAPAIAPRGAVAQERAGEFDLIETTIADVHRAFRSSELTARRLTQIYLDRIEAYDRTTTIDGEPAPLNAFVVLNPRALDRADELDREFRETGRLRPLHGIPVVVKDNYDTHDLQTAAGSAALAGSLPPDDAFMVRRLREAGAIVLGKTNMGEWAFSPLETVSSILGVTRNPYDLSRVPAGSSGGTAAAVAANLGMFGLGTDTGNSIRGPSSHCALVGIRPTIGLTSRDGIVPLYLGQDVGGPMARTVADAAIALGVLAGRDPADPVTEASRGKHPESYAAHLKADGLRGARLGVLRAYFETESTDAQIKDLMEKAIADLKAAGAEIVDPWVQPARPRGRGGRRNNFHYDVNNYLASLGPNAPVKTLADVIATGKVHPLNEQRLRRAAEQALPATPEEAPLPGVEGDPNREAFRDAVIAAMDELRLDAVIYPTWSNPPRAIDDRRGPTGDNSQVLAPQTGMPAITVPMGYTHERLPAGLQMLGRPYAEGRLIELAHAYERATKHRRPPEGFGPIRRSRPER
jgi:Asp-tRNA(Asn)/Glu-tRNA(Gln) amidotransferase A subunit family amidase